MADQYDVIVLDSDPGVYVAAISAGEARRCAIDRADGAQSMQAFKASVEAPLGLVA